LLGVCGGFSSIWPDGNQWQTNQRQSALSTPLSSGDLAVNRTKDAGRGSKGEARRTNWTKLGTQMAATLGRDCG